MRSVVRRGIAFVRRHVLLLILGVLALLAVAVVLWAPPAWVPATFAAVQENILFVVVALWSGFALFLLFWTLPKMSRGGLAYNQKVEKVEIVKNIVEIVAIGYAGIWAFYTFGLKDRPGLESRVQTESELTWTDVSGTGTCEAAFKVKFQNIGTTAFDISEIHIHRWEFPAPVLEGTEVAKYLDVNTIQPTATECFVYKSEDKENLIWAPFLDRYPPGTTWEHSFQFLIKRRPKIWVLFRLDIFDKDDRLNPKDKTYQWGLVCGKGSAGKTARSSPVARDRRNLKVK